MDEHEPTMSTLPLIVRSFVERQRLTIELMFVFEALAALCR